MKNFKRALSAILAFLLIAVCLTSCAEEETYVAMVAGEKITQSEYVYNVIQSMNNYESTYQTTIVWNDTINDQVAEDFFAETALEQIARYRVIMQNAEALGFGWNKDNQKEVNEYINNAIKKAGGKSYFKEQLQSMMIDEDYFRFMAKYSILYNQLFEGLFKDGGKSYISDADMKTAYNANYYHYKEIYVSTLNEKGIPLKQSEKDAQKAIAEDLYKQLTNGTSFDTLAAKYSMDEKDDIKDSNGGYYKMASSMTTKFYKAISGLKEGETSKLVETDYGYHIIMRLPIEEDYMNEHIDEFRDTFELRTFNAMVDEWIANCEVAVYDDFYTISPNALYDYYLADKE